MSPTILAILSIIKFLVLLFKVLKVPSSFTSSHITLCASPPYILPIVKTAALFGSKFLLIIVCNDVTICEAVTIASIPFSGYAP